VQIDKGLFVTFEGIDGSGKSTQVSALRKSLEDKGTEVVVIREPGATLIGEKIRSILLDKDHSKMSSETELLLYEAARAQIVNEVIRPALQAGKVVICDRFYDSTVAYQGYARGLSLESIDFLNQLATGGLEPDLTFLLDLPAEDAWERMDVREGAQDRLELEGFRFMEKVRAGYLELAGKHARIIKVDALSPATVLAKYIDRKFWEVVNT
jgi:dTMP kinase